MIKSHCMIRNNIESLSTISGLVSTNFWRDEDLHNGWELTKHGYPTAYHNNYMMANCHKLPEFFWEVGS